MDASDRAALPILCARAWSSSSSTPTTSAPVAQASTSRSGSRNSSSPSQLSLMMQAPAPAASNTRVAGENPLATIESRVTFRTVSGEQLKALCSPGGR